MTRLPDKPVFIYCRKTTTATSLVIENEYGMQTNEIIANATLDHQIHML